MKDDKPAVALSLASALHDAGDFEIFAFVLAVGRGWIILELLQEVGRFDDDGAGLAVRLGLGPCLLDRLLGVLDGGARPLHPQSAAARHAQRAGRGFEIAHRQGFLLGFRQTSPRIGHAELPILLLR